MADFEDTLLLLEADPGVARQLQEHLVATGYHVVTAASLTQWRESSPRLAPDLVIADCAPCEVAALLAALGAVRPTPPVIVHTPVTTMDDLLAFLRSGAADVVPRPLVDIAFLDQAVNRQIERVRLYRENQRYRQELEVANKELRAGLEELQADQRAGRQVQMKMLPEHGLRISGLHFDYCLKPSLYLSGDFFEYFRLDEHKAAFYFADVSGHGASSAFVTVLLKNLCNRLKRNLRRGSSDDLIDPQRFMARVNSELLDTAIGKHLTLFFGIIDLEQRTLHYSVGAHFPMPILTQQGRSVYLEGKGPPVGLFEGARYPRYEVPLAPGFTIVICSDGLLEVINARSLADKERVLLETVERTGATVADLERVFGLESISDLPDDIAIVSIVDSGGAR